MFDSSKQFVVKILSGGEKQCTVRYPSDAEWCERAAKQMLVRRLLGRSRPQYEALDGETVDAELFARIRLDEDGAPFDEAEAAKVIARLERVPVIHRSAAISELLAEIDSEGEDDVEGF